MPVYPGGRRTPGTAREICDEVVGRLNAQPFSGDAGTGQLGAVTGVDLEHAIREVVKDVLEDARVSEDGYLILLS